jgi:hypothetical protein
MIAFTPDRGRKLVATEEEVRTEFADFDTHFMLEDDEGSALLATGEDFGPYTLEWFSARRSGSHLEAVEELKRSEVLAAMLDYLRGGSAWRESRPWCEVADEGPGWLDRLLMGLWRGPA